MDVKQALMDQKFRISLPESLKLDVQEFLSNPGCSCNHKIYRKVMKVGHKELADYYPTKEKIDPEKEVSLPRNEFTVINCHIKDLEKKLKGLPPGRKEIAITRFEEQVTVIINDLEI